MVVQADGNPPMVFAADSRKMGFIEGLSGDRAVYESLSRWKLKDWLGGLDSNQDNQIQNLMYCQLYDLPAGCNWRVH
jgi:hypothetical protein